MDCRRRGFPWLGPEGSPRWVAERLARWPEEVGLEMQSAAQDLLDGQFV